MKSKNRIFYFIFIMALGTPLFCISQTSFSEDSAFVALVEPHAVYNNDFIRDTFYTWTTPDQITELRMNKKLLTKSKSATKGFSLYDITLRDTALRNLPVIKLLQQEQFAKKRFAWTNSWATIMGLEGESYGNQLLKIVLNDSSIIGKFDIENLADPIQFFNLKGKPLNVNYVIENQDRIAVIYHVNNVEVIRTEAQMKKQGTFYRYTNKYKKEKGYVKYREYVIVNSNMIKTWSYGTEEIKNELTAEINFLKQLQSSKFANQIGYKDECELYKIEQLYNVQCVFEAAKCFNNDYYLLNKKRLQMIIDQLQLALTQQSASITK